MRSFHEFNRRLAAYSPGFRCLIDAHGGATAGEWRLLTLEASDRNERLNGHDAVLDFEPPKRRTVPHGTPTSTSTGAGRVQLEDDDPLRRIPASQYLPAIAGVEVSSTGRCRCPMPDHTDEHPSAKVYDEVLWTCFSCGGGSDIFAIASAVSGIPTTGSDWWRLRDWILERMVWAPLPGQGRAD